MEATGFGNARVTSTALWIETPSDPALDRKESPAGDFSVGSIRRRKVYATSSAVSGVPSEKRRPLLSFKCSVLPSGLTFH